jgi:hypothetical protein
LRVADFSAGECCYSDESRVLWAFAKALFDSPVERGQVSGA